jgi:glutamate N-acetyltransferase/amino-acid N-acetyltransferase
MIHPNLATMLGFIVTDYPLSPGQARAMLRRSAERSFNCLTVDGDMSTNDTLLLLANGAIAPRKAVNKATDERFAEALREVAQDLARQMARDGEGSTRLVTIDVRGAKDGDDAHQIAMSIAKSNLVKTAIFGHDPNWGRICCAAGYARVPFDVNDFSLKLQGKLLMRRGLPVTFDRAALSQALDGKEVTIEVNIGKGRGAARVWTCDLTYDYVKINAEYTT